MSGDLAYKFDIATNQTEERFRVLGVEFYARSMTLAEQLRVNKMRSNARRISQQEQDGESKSVLEMEMEVLADVLKSKAVNAADKRKVTAEWLAQLNQGEYYRLFNFMLTGEDLEANKQAEEGDDPNS